jgi:hypothetical protein
LNLRLAMWQEKNAHVGKRGGNAPLVGLPAPEFPVSQVDCRVVGLAETRRGAIRTGEVVGGQLSIVRHEMRDGALVGDTREPFSLLSIIERVCHRESPAATILS